MTERSVFAWGRERMEAQTANRKRRIWGEGNILCIDYASGFTDADFHRCVCMYNIYNLLKLIKLNILNRSTSCM